MTTSEIFLKEDSFEKTITITIKVDGTEIRSKVEKWAFLLALRKDLGWEVEE